MILHAQEAQDPPKKGVFWGPHQQNTVVAQPDLAAWGDGGTPQPPGRVGGRGPCGRAHRDRWVICLSCWWGSAQNSDIVTSAGHAKAQKAAHPPTPPRLRKGRGRGGRGFGLPSVQPLHVKGP